MIKVSYLIVLIWMSIALTGARKVRSHRPSLKQFRDDYITVKKTCQEVGFVSYCNPKTGHSRKQVAFTVVMSKRSYFRRHPRILPFDTTKLNLGNAFNTKTYKFTSPERGTYGFTWSIANNNNYNIHSNLVKNGKVYHGINCITVGRNYAQCSDTVFIWLNKSDQVWLQSRSGTFDAFAHYSSFSGWKMN